MKVEELRIGNWVLISGQKTIIKDIAYSPYIEDNCRANNVKVSEIEPIPLTAEILKKAGFKEPDSSDQFGGYLIEVWDGYKIRVRQIDSLWTWDYYGHAIVCHWVHQLQNLYYSLTQTELTIDL